MTKQLKQDLQGLCGGNGLCRPVCPAVQRIVTMQREHSVMKRELRYARRIAEQFSGCQVTGYACGSELVGIVKRVEKKVRL